MKTVFIYSLSTLEMPNDIRYIGKTNNLNKRIATHKYYNKNSHQSNWLKSELKKGNTPIINIVDEVLESEWEFWEIYWISQFKTWGFNLTNKANGGTIGFNSIGKKINLNTIKKITLKTNKPVIQYDLFGNIINTFSSLTEASKAINCTISNISECCKQKHRTVKNTVFRYDGDVFDYVINNKSITKTSKRVEQYDLYENVINIFDSIHQASKLTGVIYSSISECCNNKTNHNTAGGFKWKFK